MTLLLLLLVLSESPPDDVPGVERIEQAVDLGGVGFGAEDVLEFRFADRPVAIGIDLAEQGLRARSDRPGSARLLPLHGDQRPQRAGAERGAGRTRRRGGRAG